MLKFKITAFLLINFFSIAAEQTINLSTLMSHIPRRSDGKIAIPNQIKHIKLDIGLSYNAPHSQQWLSNEEDLMVFGFEPNPGAVESIVNGYSKTFLIQEHFLDTKYIGKNFFVITCALGMQNCKVPFYITSNDWGCSSMYKPISFPLADVIEVPVFRLADFFDLFPFDTHPVIEYIKIDAQGSDLNIAKSAGNYLSERVVYITLEEESTQYAGTCNSQQEMDEYMLNIGFVRHYCSETSDPTYFNLRFKEYIKTHTVKIYQQA